LGFEETGLEGVDCSPFRLHKKAGNFLTSWATVVKNDSAPLS